MASNSSRNPPENIARSASKSNSSFITAVMKELFDFEALRAMFSGGFRLLFDAMHGVTGPYAHHIFERVLGAREGTVIHGTPLEDFGGHHPDPNLVHAAELVAHMNASDAPDLGAACDGDGDRNL